MHRTLGGRSTRAKLTEIAESIEVRDDVPVTDAPASPDADPIAPSERITNLDTVRGFATLGILVMNAVSYGLPEAAYFNLDAAGSRNWLDWVVGVLGEILVDQKAMALFSLLFGVGIVVFADRAVAKGRRPIRLSLWRNLLLLGIGGLHSLIWEGDILILYAGCAPILLLLRTRKPRTLMAAGIGMVLASAVWAAIAQTQIPASGEGLGDFWFVGAGDIGDVAGVFFIADFILRALGMMLIGVALYRFGIIQGTRPAHFYRRMVRFGFGIGFPLVFVGLAIQFSSDFSPSIALIGEAPNTLATIPIALGYLGLIALWNQRPTTESHERIRAVGRMALTNYLTQTIIGVTMFRVIFDRGDAGRSGLAAFVLAVWALQIIWSTAWLDRFRFGPFEWAWRSATYRSVQPLRRS